MENKNLKNRRTKVGRPPYILNEKLFLETLKRVKNNEISNVEAMSICNCRKTLYYRFKKKLEASLWILKK